MSQEGTGYKKLVKSTCDEGFSNVCLFSDSQMRKLDPGCDSQDSKSLSFLNIGNVYTQHPEPLSLFRKSQITDSLCFSEYYLGNSFFSSPLVLSLGFDTWS